MGAPEAATICQVHVDGINIERDRTLEKSSSGELKQGAHRSPVSGRFWSSSKAYRVHPAELLSIILASEYSYNAMLAVHFDFIEVVNDESRCFQPNNAGFLEFAAHDCGMA